MLFDSLANVAPSAVAIGDFDGVHIGHAEIIGTLSAKSKELGLTPVAVTFDINTKNSRVLLSSEQKARLLKHYGAEYVIAADFYEIRNIEASEFAERLYRAGVRYAVCGQGFGFGKNASGDYKTLENAGIKTAVLPPVVAEGDVVSSTRIRNAILSGDMPLAKALLGREPDFK